MSKGHSSVSSAAEHCLRHPRPQASRLQSCSSRTRHHGLPHPCGYQKTQNQEGCRMKAHRKNHQPIWGMKVSAGAPYGLGSSCSPGRGHERRLSHIVVHMFTYTCCSPMCIATLFTSPVAAQALSSCQLTCFLLPVSEPLMSRIRNENSVSLSAEHWNPSWWFRTFKPTFYQKTTEAFCRGLQDLSHGQQNVVRTQWASSRMERSRTAFSRVLSQ